MSFLAKNLNITAQLESSHVLDLYLQKMSDYDTVWTLRVLAKTCMNILCAQFPQNSIVTSLCSILSFQALSDKYFSYTWAKEWLHGVFGKKVNRSQDYV